MKTLALYTMGRRFEPHRRRFFTPTVVLLSLNQPATVLWTIVKYYYYYIYLFFCLSLGEKYYIKLHVSCSPTLSKVIFLRILVDISRLCCHQAVVRKLSVSSQAVVRWLSGIC